MGLYSTNRINSVAESTEEVKNTLVEEVKEEVNFEEFSGCDNLIEAVIELHENEAKMFNSLIELDFASATNEQTMLESDATILNEKFDSSKVQEIKKKIVEMWETFKTKIKEVIGSAINKIKSIFDFDTKLIKHYEEAMKKADFKDFPGLKNFALPKAIVNKAMLNEVLPDSLPFEQRLNTIAADDNEALDKALADYKATQKKADEYYEHFMKDAFEANSESWKPSGNDVDTVIKGVKDNKQLINGLKDAGAAVIGAVNTAKRQYGANKREAKKAGYAFEAKIAKTQYTLAAANIKDISLCVNAAINVAGKQAAAYRKAMSALGTYAVKMTTVKNAEEKVNTESVEMLIEAVCLASDIAVANIME